MEDSSSSSGSSVNGTLPVQEEQHLPSVPIDKKGIQCLINSKSARVSFVKPSGKRAINVYRFF